MTKYIKKFNDIFEDYYFYLAQENIYTLLFGHNLGIKAKRKSNYIWNRLIDLYYFPNGEPINV